MTARNATHVEKHDSAGDTRQPARVIVGHCPSCKRVVLVENHYGIWPLVYCECTWRGATTEVEHHVRFERGGTFEGTAPTGRVRSGRDDAHDIAVAQALEDLQ